jgi:sterol desaturase/sphingolipid hydroxylase (fatty acid hydroxylase superfamily)
MSHLLLISVTWRLFEYFIHRYLFHYRSTNKNILSLIAYSHTIHHDYPRDLKRLIMPPIISVPLAYAFFILFKMVLGSYYQAIYAGFMLGYVMYDSLHYLLHRFNLKNSLFYYLKKNHFHHHFRDNTRCFSVTSPYWDTIMKTRPKH